MMGFGRWMGSVALAIALGVGGAVEVARAEGAAAGVVQVDALAELNALIDEGMRLFREGSAESLRQAIIQFEIASQLGQEIQVQNKQALAFLMLGRANYSLGETSQALRFYEQALPLWRIVKDSRGEAVTLNNIGTVYNFWGEKEKALDFRNQALSLSRAIEDDFGEAVALNNIGTIYESMGDREKALNFYNQALPLWKIVGDRVGEASTLNNIGDLHNALGEKRKALNFYERALLLWQALEDRSGEATTLGNLGTAYDDLGEKEKALEFHQQALLLWEVVGDPSGKATAFINIGVVYDSLGEKKKALSFFSQALPLKQELGDRSGQASVLNNIGGIYDALGRKAEALDFYNQALALRRAVGDRVGESIILNNIGFAYDSLGEKKKALNSYNQALTLQQVVGDRAGEARTLNNIGLVYHSLGEEETALNFYNQSLPLWQAVEDRSGEASTLNNLGGTYDDLGNREEALRFYNQSLPLRQEVGDPSGEAVTLNNIGSIYHASGETENALDFYSQALLLRQTVGDRSGEAITLNNIAMVLIKDQPAAAIAFYKQSINLYETLRQDIRTLPRETQEQFTSTVAYTYRNLADALLSQNRTREAQAVLELLKVQEFNLYETNTEPSPPVQFPLHSLEAQAWQAAEQAITAQTLTLDTLTAIGQPLEQNKAQIAQDLNNSPLNIGNPQALLTAKPNALIIQNLVVGDKLWVLWTDADGNTTHVTVPNASQADLNATVQTFRDQIGSPYSNLNDLNATSETLYNWLIPPQLQAELAAAEAAGQPKQQLIFSLDHVTRYIPVAALYDGEQYLAQRYSLSNLVTTETDVEDRLFPQGQPPNILALGTSQAHPGFSALPNVDAELKAIVKDDSSSETNKGLYPGKIRLNRDFTAEALQDNLNSYEVLHIATHGKFNPNSISASYLLLGDGARLPITDIASLTNLDETHLVVLSACETGLSGSSQDGTEISGISGYFLRRGAKSVLASLWAVNDASTALLMQQFYQHLKNGELTKAEALQKVQREFIAGELTVKEAKALSRAGVEVIIPEQRRSDSFAHPYYWAPFVLVGNSL